MSTAFLEQALVLSVQCQYRRYWLYGNTLCIVDVGDILEQMLVMSVKCQ